MNLDEISERIKTDIDEYCAHKYDDGLRKHLGASVIGEECLRRSWYAFRWVKREVFDGRMQRLFNRGHREEERFIEWLQGIGFQVHTVDPETQKQFKMKYVRGHYGGSLDSVGIAPQYFPNPVLLEFKTFNTKTFISLLREKVKQFRPKHYAQMCSYGRAYGLSHALYCAINKNDDDLHIELVELDHGFGEDLTRKAEIIIDSQEPPKRISDDPANWKCKYCFAHSICHYDDKSIMRNCRSCINAFPAHDGQWYCQHFNSIIPDDFVAVGCPDGYKSIV